MKTKRNRHFQSNTDDVNTQVTEMKTFLVCLDLSKEPNVASILSMLPGLKQSPVPPLMCSGWGVVHLDSAQFLSVDVSARATCEMCLFMRLT